MYMLTPPRRLSRLSALLLAFTLALCTLAARAEGSVTLYEAAQEMPLLSQPESTLQVFCIPVGAQDCYLLVCEGHAMVMDCAALGRDPTPDFLLKLLGGLGIERLDYIINTPPHADHVNGFPALLDAIPAGEFLTVFPHDYSYLQKCTLKAVEERGVPIRDYTPGDPLTLGSAQLSTFQYRRSKNTNDLSLVVRVQYGERSILFTADIGLTAQRKLGEQYGSALDADILKLPHHGVGGLAEALYNAVSPELCFASNGPTSHEVDTMRKFLNHRSMTLLFTSRMPLAMVTDGAVWQAQQWEADSIRLPGLTLLANR